MHLAGGNLRNADAHRAEAASLAERTLRAVAVDDDEEMAGALTLGAVEWVPQHGQFKVDLPVVRLGLGSITAWWVVGGKVVETAERGSRFFIGGVFPLPIGH